MSAAQTPFWRHKRLDEMSRIEWESLCDGCAKCCLFKLQDEDTDEIHQTNVACRLIDPETCQCTRYRERSQLVPDCVTLEPHHLDEFDWLPSTCAYRLLHEGKDLPDWHPLVSGDLTSVFASGHSIRGRFIPQDEADDLQDCLVPAL
ncbi:MAG: YcgN family cysteine cluster protein [Gammaproteobacteria bacterium]|nr:YcgN family cysteine cluster protein [Gammaproteobacteria bacterium]MCP5137048.1 YcgN family cysteine cluster protein [Gammaproteobacteria bacterium]